MNGFPPRAGGPLGPPPSQAQTSPAEGAAQEVQKHYCFSGALTCSGCNPCDACAQILKQYILVPALLEEQTALTQDLQLALQQSRPIDLQLLADTFFKMVAAAWRQLHATMESMPAESRPFRVMNVTKILEAAEIGRQVLVDRERAQQQQSGRQAAPNAHAPTPGQKTGPQPVVPSKPVDFDRAMRAGDAGSSAPAPAPAPVPASSPVITVQPDPPRPAVSEADFARAAPPPNGQEAKETKTT